MKVATTCSSRLKKLARLPLEPFSRQGPYSGYPPFASFTGTARRAAACRLSRGLQLQEPFRLLPLQPVLDLGRLSFDVTP
jgi:hypothetical protein